ncbi:glycine betaine ABC transporter substrate-binding protein [Chloroflexota bacterium]
MKLSSLLKIKSLDFIIIAAFVCILLIIFTIGRSAGSVQIPKATIVFGDAGWDSIQVYNRIAAFILENGYGYKADFAPGETVSLLQALVRGDIDVEMEVWIKSQQEAYNKAMDTGQIVNLGTNFADNCQGWLVPTYVI